MAGEGDHTGLNVVTPATAHAVTVGLTGTSPSGSAHRKSAGSAETWGVLHVNQVSGARRGGALGQVSLVLGVHQLRVAHSIIGGTKHLDSTVIA